MTDFVQVDREQRRFSRAHSRFALPAARALALSHSLASLPANTVGREALIDESRLQALAWLREAATSYPVDPELVDQIARIWPTVATELAAVPAAGARAPKQESQIGEGLIRCVFPVFQRLPGSNGNGSPHGVAALVQLCIEPHPFQRERDAVRWLGPVHEVIDVGHLPLYEVAQGALRAAMSVTSALGRSVRSGAPHSSRPTPDSIVQSPAILSVTFDCSLREQELRIVGSSAGFSLAVSFLATILAERHGGRGVFPRADWAWTGEVTLAGDVMDVDPASLRAKVRAAYWGGMRGITVPIGQLVRAREYVPSGERPFSVLGAANIRDALHSRDATEEGRLPRSSIREPLAKKRPPLRVFFVAIAIAFLLGAVAYWLQTKARSVGPSPTIDASLRTVTVSFKGGARPRTYADEANRPIAGALIASSLPGDNAPASTQRLVVLTESSSGRSAMLSVLDLGSKTMRPIWSYEFDRSSLPEDPRRDRPDATYNGKQLLVEDLDGDGDQEIVVALSLHPFSTSTIELFDDSSTPVGAVLHSGHVEALRALDWDGDGVPEVIVAGVHQPTAGGSVTVLRGSDFPRMDENPTNHADGDAVRTNPQSSASRQSLEPQPCLADFVFPRHPHVADGLAAQEMCVPPTSLETSHQADGTPVIRFALGVSDDGLCKCYIISLVPPHALVGVTADAVLKQAARDWIREGRTRYDFAARESIEEWSRTFRVYDYVVRSATVDASKPLVAAGAPSQP